MSHFQNTDSTKYCMASIGAGEIMQELCDVMGVMK